MISERDIYRAAVLLRRQFADLAEVEAARRADLMLERGDRDGQLVWQRIIHALKALHAPENSTVH